MSSLMLINPARRRKSARSPAQKAATRRMLAANRHKNPRKRHAASVTYTRGHTVHRRKKNPSLRAHRRHRNPLNLGRHAAGIGGLMMAGLKGAGGAVVVNVVCNFLPAAIVPVSVPGTTNFQLYAVRTALAVAMGTVGKKVLGSSARDMAVGALTVNFHDFLNNFVGTVLPGSGLRGLGMDVQNYPALNVRQALPQPGRGQVFDQELAGMGEYLMTH
jgi:hypothetical protein